MKIGEIMALDREITLNEGKESRTLAVVNTGDRPVQVGSHYHFFEVNRCLSFDREQAYGFHLDIPSGTSVRFEPGEEKEGYGRHPPGIRPQRPDLCPGFRGHKGGVSGKSETKGICLNRRDCR